MGILLLRFIGLNTLIALPDKPQEILVKIPEAFKILVKEVKKNAEDRINEEGGEDDYEEEQSDGDEDVEDLKFESDDDEDFWEELYDDNYNSKLD